MTPEYIEFKKTILNSPIDPEDDNSHYQIYIRMKLLVHVDCILSALTEADTIEEFTNLLHLIVQYPKILTDFTIKPIITAGITFVNSCGLKTRVHEESELMIEGLRDLNLIDY